jgi:hypothetical protein
MAKAEIHILIKKQRFNILIKMQTVGYEPEDRGGGGRLKSIDGHLEI